MKISHKVKNISGEQIVYIYVNVQDIYEFGKENLGKGENTDFLTKLREYIKNNLSEFKKAAAIIVINGVIIGSLSLAAIYPNEKNIKEEGNSLNQIQVYQEKTIEKEEKISEDELAKENLENKTEEKTSTNTNKTNVTTSKKESGKTNVTTSKKPTSTNNKINTTNSNTAKPNNTVQNNVTISKPTTNTKDEDNNTSSNTQINSDIKIKLNNGGTVSEIDLEEYVIGVVAAEMPASFHSEALKAQAVVARTYAMKKASKGITLLNSTTHQVYYTTSQMKSKWGTSFNTYYNKIKNAVNATKGKVLKYNNSYIDALYFSMSNGKTELPSYVWDTDYPYLQVVSSSWDENISAAKHTLTMSYSKLSSKLGITVNKDSEIEILSRTAGDRVNKISIGGKTFTGVKVRSLLGLRSADFTITKTESGVTITTKGFGHGVGMSQYGANGAAKAGNTYKQILSHYYSGVSLVNI